MTLNRVNVNVYEDSETSMLVLRDHKGNVRVYIDPATMSVTNGLGQQTPFTQSPLGHSIGIQMMETKFRFLDRIKK